MGTRDCRVRMAYAPSTALLAMLLSAVLAIGCGQDQTDWQNQLDAHKAAATQLLVQNSQLRDFLQNDLYEIDGDVFITTNQSIGDKSAVILSDGKLMPPDGYNLDWYEAVKQYEPMILEVFDKFACETIHLGAATGKRVLHVYLGDFEIGDDSLFAESLDYCRDDVSALAERVFPDWYYSASLYE
jgi:hypothetical protein